MLSCGIYHPEANGFFGETKDYLNWQKRRDIPLQRKVGIIFYYAQLMEGGVAEVDALVAQCEKKGLCAIPVFSTGVEKDPDPDWTRYLADCEGLGVIISCMAGRLLRQKEDITLLEKIGIPIVQTLRSYSQTADEWFEDPQGLPAMSAVFSQTYPEIFGCIRPGMIAGVRLQPDGDHGSWMRQYEPIAERIETLVVRLLYHFKLIEKQAHEKKLTIVLHNNPCKGVEATIGMAVGLDSFTSLALLLQRLADEGYNIGDCPTDGKALLDLFLTRKAIAEFRWTTIDEIITKGGDIYYDGER